jgi:AraC-like DNA-binding protein
MREKDLRQLYMRGKALEALALTIDALARMPLRALRLSARDRRAIDEARRLIETSPGEPWTIAALAEAVGLSESKLKIGFREIVGVSTRVYLRQIRIERAADMIASGQPVTEAALATGFQNLSHFSKAFRIVKGVGPRQFAGGIRRHTPS